jgi:hypothetical protein
VSRRLTRGPARVAQRARRGGRRVLEAKAKGPLRVRVRVGVDEHPVVAVVHHANDVPRQSGGLRVHGVVPCAYQQLLGAEEVEYRNVDVPVYPAPVLAYVQHGY